MIAALPSSFRKARKRRQRVIPLSQPSSWGSVSHRMPLFKTNTIPLKAARSVMLRARPPLGFGGSGGKSGATSSHSLPLINGVLMPPIYHTARVLFGALTRRASYALFHRNGVGMDLTPQAVRPRFFRAESAYP
jgi:hypothetical protein